MVAAATLDGDEVTEMREAVLNKLNYERLVNLVLAPQSSETKYQIICKLKMPHLLKFNGDSYWQQDVRR